jgi:hypothetical protein
MPLQRTYGQDILPQLAAAAGAARGDVQAERMDQQIVQRVRNRQLQEQKNRVAAQKARNELEAIRAQQDRRRRGGTMAPNRARLTYPNRGNRSQGGTPLEQQVRQALERKRQQNQDTEEPQPNPYTDQDQADAQSAVLRGPDQTYRIEDGGAITAEPAGGGEKQTVAPASQEGSSLNTLRKQAALKAAGADRVLKPEQIDALQRMAGDEGVGLQEFRQWVGEAAGMAPGPGPSSDALQMTPADAAQRRFTQLRNRAQRLRQDVAASVSDPDQADVEELTQQAEKTKRASDSVLDYVPGLGDPEPQNPVDTETVEKVKQYQQYQRKMKQLLGIPTDSGSDSKLAPDTPEDVVQQPGAEQAQQPPQQWQAPNGESVSLSEIRETAQRENVPPQQVVEDLQLQPVQ